MIDPRSVEHAILALICALLDVGHTPEEVIEGFRKAAESIQRMKEKASEN